MLATVSAVERRSLRVHGVVQGVGFRPFVHRLATSLGVGGSVGNDAAGVVIEVVGAERVAVGVEQARVDTLARPVLTERLPDHDVAAVGEQR